MKAGEVSNWSRVLWTVLGLMLVGPFLAGLAVAGAIILAPVFKLAPLLPEGLPNAGVSGVTAFVWAALPSAVAAILVAPVVVRSGTVSLLWAAAAGVLGFFLATLVTDMPFRDSIPGLAFLAALVAIGVRYALMAGGIITESDGASSPKDRGGRGP